jgi:hypothetical protein
MKRLLTKWWFVSLIAGITSAILSLVYFVDLKFNTAVFIFVFIVCMALNPLLVYWRFALMFFGAFLTLNRFGLSIDFEFKGIRAFFTVSPPELIINIMLLLMAMLSILFYFLEKNPNFKLFGTIRLFSPEVNAPVAIAVHGNAASGVEGPIIQGSDGAMIQTINIEQVFIVDGQEVRGSEIEELIDLKNRGDELLVLIQNSTGDLRQSYLDEFANIETRAEQLKTEISDITSSIRSLRDNFPQDADTMSQFLQGGSYKRAKEYFFELMERRRDAKFAETIGLDYDELLELDYWIEDGHRSSDGMLYRYDMWITKESASPEIIERINRNVEEIGEEYCVEVYPWEVMELEGFPDEN